MEYHESAYSGPIEPNNYDGHTFNPSAYVTQARNEGYESALKYETAKDEEDKKMEYDDHLAETIDEATKKDSADDKKRVDDNLFRILASTFEEDMAKDQPVQGATVNRYAKGDKPIKKQRSFDEIIEAIKLSGEDEG